MSSQLFNLSDTDTALTVSAAATEPDRAHWEYRFRSLLESKVLTLPGRAGSEFGLSAGNCGRSVTRGSIENLYRQVLSPALSSGCRVSLDVSGLAEQQLGLWQQLLSEDKAFSADSVFGVSLGIGQSLQGPVIRRLKRWLRGNGRIAIRYSVPESTTKFDAWHELVRQSHSNIRIQPVPVSALRPLSPLHNREKGQAVMPTGLFDARSLTAWLIVDLDVRQFGQPKSLRCQLADSLRFADNLIDAIDWPMPALQLDALLNRRVALRLSNIGNMLAAHGITPTMEGAFHHLQRWLMFVRSSFVHESRMLARRRGPFPGLDASELVDRLTGSYGVADARRLVRNRMLRHRHLLALSPLSLFPDESHPGSAAEWINLVPAIGWADAITMAGPEIRTRLSMSEWERLLRLTAALAAGGLRSGSAGLSRAY